jgi:hypothetical protein
LGKSNHHMCARLTFEGKNGQGFRSCTKCLIDTCPLATEEGDNDNSGSERAMASLLIGQLKERICAAFTALVDLMTNLFQCVKVEARKRLLLALVLCKEPDFIRRLLAIQSCLLV